MNATRRAALGLLAAPMLARAQDFPSRPIRLIATYPPGGGVDTTARLLAGPMAAFLGQPIVVENRAGAGGSIGAADLARATPDGHTIMVDASAHAVNPALLRGLPFDYARAFAPISQVTVLPQIMVAALTLPYATLPAFVAHARNNPGRLTYGSSGNASAAHLAAALLVRRAGIDLAHAPYRGGAPALQDALAGRLAFVFGTVSSSLQLVQDGRLTALGVSTARRVASLPNVPSIGEQGFPGFVLNEWNGVWAPAGTPAPVVGRLHAACRHALADAGVQARLTALGAEGLGSTPAEFDAWLTAERAAMATLVRDAAISVD